MQSGAALATAGVAQTVNEMPAIMAFLRDTGATRERVSTTGNSIRRNVTPTETLTLAPCLVELLSTGG